MAHPLYLAEDEKKLFSALPESVKEGWEVSTETLHFEDNELRRKARLELMEISDPKLIFLRGKLQTMPSPDDVIKTIEHTDLTGVSDGDLGELFFAMGPDVISLMVRDLIGSASSDEEMERVSQLSSIRHNLLESLQVIS